MQHEPDRAESVAPVELKPAPIPFVVIPAFGVVADWSVGLTVVGFLAWLFEAPIAPRTTLIVAAAVLTAVLLAVIAVRARRWQRTRYLIAPDILRIESGGFTWHVATELQVPRITQVMLVRPWLQKLLFGTGSVAVTAAGTRGAHIVLSSVRTPDVYYRQIESLMRAQGVPLSRERLVQSERPSVLQLIADLSGSALKLAVGFGVVGFLALLGLKALFSVASVAELLAVLRVDVPVDLPDKITWRQARWGSIAALGVMLLLLLRATVRAALMAVDRMRRRYLLHADVIDYRDGFLTERHQFIPVRNIADITVGQAMLQRLFGIGNVRVSCQGVAGDIGFPSMPNAPQFVANVQILRRPKEAELADPARRPALELRMAVARAVLPTLVRNLTKSAVMLLIFVAFTRFALNQLDETGDRAGAERVVGIALPVIAVIVLLSNLAVVPQLVTMVVATSYRISPDGVERRHQLLARNSVQFSLDKITAFTIRQNAMDRLFRTARVDFHSIGSRVALSWAHVPQAMVRENEIAEWLGYPRDHPARVVHSEPTMSRVLLANAGGIIGSIVFAALLSLLGFLHRNLLLVPAIVVVAQVAGLFFERLLHQRTVLQVGGGTVRVRRDFVTRYVFTARLHNLVGLRSWTFPFRGVGNLVVIAAGGARARVRYLTDVIALHNELDGVLHLHPPREAAAVPQREDVIWNGRPRVANSVMRAVIGSILFFPLLPFLPITAWLMGLGARRTAFVLEHDRALERTRLFGDSQHSLLLNRLESVTFGQGMLNKLFGNGWVGLSAFGPGSSVVFRDISDHHDVAGRIESLTGRAAEGAPAA